MIYLISLLSLVISGAPTPSCDYLEINHVCSNADGTEAFTQLLAWDWSPQHRRFDCQQWVFIELFWRSGAACNVRTKDGQTLQITAKMCRETWTRHDPERYNLRLFGQEFRRKVW